MRKLLVTLALMIGVAHAQDAEFGVQYEDGGLVPFIYVAQYFPLGNLGAIDLYVTPSAELVLSEPLEGWIGAELLVDTAPFTLSARAKYDTRQDDLSLRIGILLGQ